ncbi:Putative Spherulin-1B [[Torrubiella] hemipterigena]|uniref:Putative Spherulin-1B n=1 Tax=[Torrubiella] hemipterigena TaxID=1531966 RepID=A0A0A1TIF0_9HYPO|nr:Putative Spherulin-1B [[Torrubiella] hemipterigena]
MRRAIHTGDALLFERILKSHKQLLHNPDSSTQGISNSNLHLAASLGHKRICETLLAAGHETPNPALNEQHQTALMLAARAGHLEAVRVIAENDYTCILRRDIRGRDAIMEASAGGHDKILQFLLAYVPGGAYEAVQRADGEGNTALHFASINGNLMGLRILLVAGADAETTNAWNWTPASYSASVQAEVYLKGLVVEMKNRKMLRQEIEGARISMIKKVESDDDDDDEDDDDDS